jgi:hypothetical protein
MNRLSSRYNGTKLGAFALCGLLNLFIMLFIVAYRVSFLQTVSKTMPETNIHRGDDEVGGRQSHSHYHNVRRNFSLVVAHFLVRCILFVSNMFVMHRCTVCSKLDPHMKECCLPTRRNGHLC